MHGTQGMQAFPDAGALRAPSSLDDLLLYRLSRAVRTSSGMATRLVEGGFGITRREWGMIATLAQQGEMRSSALATHLHLDRVRDDHLRYMQKWGLIRPQVRDGYAYLEGTLTSAADSQAGYDTVDRLRASVHAIPGAEAKVGGGSAVNLDIQRATRHDRNLVVPLVLGVVLVILALVLRAIVSPLLLVATVVLSFGAALGVSALVFDHLFGFAGADPAFPLWTFVFLVALGTDYNIFLMTRVHEESRRHGTRRGALIGLAATGGVITSAGIVLAGTFAALGTLPLVFITEIGFAVAFGVLLDTFVVRSVLVTALNLDVGRWIWWPSRLHHKRDVALGEPEAEAAEISR